MLVLGAGDHGRHLMSDVVISNPLAQTHVTGAAAADQFANEAAAKRKVGRYQDQAHQADWELLPLPFEVFGAMGKEVRDFILRCNRRADPECDDWNVSWATRSFKAFFTQFLSCELVRASAKAHRQSLRPARGVTLQWGSWGTGEALAPYDGSPRLVPVSGHAPEAGVDWAIDGSVRDCMWV